MPTRKKTVYAPSGENSFEIASRELLTLEPLLTKPITKSSLDVWAGGNGVREGLLANTLWGTIRWAKSLGKPLSPTLAEAFKIEHAHHQWIVQPRPGHPRFIDLLAPHPEPFKWDGPEDESFFRVSFMAEAFEGQETRIRVRFADHIGWEARVHVQGRSYLDIEPTERRFAKPKTRLVLEPFEVVARPYSRVVG